MQNHDIASEPILSSNDEGLDHNGILHSFDCECQQCAMYWSITNAALEVMMGPAADCEGDDCQGCPKCPDTPMSEIFQPVVFHDPYISHDEAMALAFERDWPPIRQLHPPSWTLTQPPSYPPCWNGTTAKRCFTTAC